MRGLFRFCLLFVILNYSFALNASLVGLGFDTECNNAFLATASLDTPYFSVRRVLPFFPHAGLKHPMLPLYFAITVDDAAKQYFLNIVDTRNWEIVHNVTLGLEGNCYIDSMKMDPYSAQIVAVSFKIQRTATPFDLNVIRINPITGQVTVLVKLPQINEYLYSSGALDSKSSLFTFLVRDGAAVLKLAKVDLPNRCINLTVISGQELANKYYLYMHHFQGQLYGLGTIATIGPASFCQALFKMNTTSGNITIVAQLDEKWNCDALSFVVSDSLGYFAVELDAKTSQKICFLDRQEVIQVMSFEGKVIHSLKYRKFPLVFTYFGFV